MKIKEVSAGVKISKNYNSYQMNLVADVENGEDAKKVGELLIEKTLEVINKKLKEGSEDKFNGLEVGAAWFDKTSKNKLSVKYSKDGNWEEVDILGLEKISEGYKQNINGEVFVFRRILEEKRKNNKMPVFRIYKMEGEMFK